MEIEKLKKELIFKKEEFRIEFQIQDIKNQRKLLQKTNEKVTLERDLYEEMCETKQEALQNLRDFVDMKQQFQSLHKEYSDLEQKYNNLKKERENAVDNAAN